MARLNTRPASSDADSTPASSPAHLPDRVASETPSSTSILAGSDKENQSSRALEYRGEKRKSTSIAVSNISMSESSRPSKRRNVEGGTQIPQSQRTQREDVGDRIDKLFYDPDQDEFERRATKKGIRDLTKRLNDSKAEYLQPHSKGLVNTLKEADQLYTRVKQTSDATIDSRLLVNIADLSYKKTNELTVGDSSIGIDVDDFVSKCMSFMRRGASTQEGAGQAVPGGTQTQRRRARQQDEENDDGDVLNWDCLGRNICFLSNARPCLSGFLLGPLSVQKKVRQPTQRRAREARLNPANAVRPLEMLDEDLEKQESANLTVVCSEIARLLSRMQRKGEAAVEAEINEMDEEVDAEQAQDIMRKHGVADNGGVPLFDFCVNPKSFGQTVENLFYISFLIKEGSVGLDFDTRGMPTLGRAEQKSVEQRQETPKNQAVFTLDFDIWEAIIDSHGIKESIIPHREEVEYDDGTGGGGEGGWY